MILITAQTKPLRPSSTVYTDDIELVEVVPTMCLMTAGGNKVCQSNHTTTASEAHRSANAAVAAETATAVTKQQHTVVDVPVTQSNHIKSANENRPLTKDDGAPSHQKPTTPSQPAARGDSTLKSMLNSAQFKRDNSLDAIVSYTRICGFIH
jgi:hypothetical protein